MRTGPTPSWHDLDPDNYNRKGKKRTGIGRWLKTNAPVIGRTVLQAGRGVLDGIPGVSQVVNTLDPQPPRSPVAAGARILVGWSTVVLIAMTMLMKLTGHIDTFTMFRLILAMLGI